MDKLKQANKTALVPFVTVGFPSLDTSRMLAKTLLNSGGDMLELGIPFSDPLADGPTIQMTSYRAIQNGANVEKSLEVLHDLRKEGVNAPLIFMGYFNPFLRYGINKFLQNAQDSGLDGIIVPDLPTEESHTFRRACERHNIHAIPLLAPTSSETRIADACKDAKGFIYCVSLTGVTGARRSLSSNLPDLVSTIRKHTDLPVIVGFGISTHEHIQEIRRFADGAVVASALLDAIDKAPDNAKLDTAKRFIQRLIGLTD